MLYIGKSYAENTDFCENISYKELTFRYVNISSLVVAFQGLSVYLQFFVRFLYIFLLSEVKQMHTFCVAFWVFHKKTRVRISRLTRQE